MKNELQLFQNEEFGSLGILLIDGKPYFPASECAAILGYSNPRKAILDHCRSVTKRDVPHPQSKNKTVSVNFIPEGDLYRLIIRSKLRSAERFESWVFDTVLPTIRKYGIYATDNTLDEMIRDPKIAETLIRMLDEERKKNDALEDLTDELAPKAIYYDLVLQSTNTVPVSLIAKDYGMSAVMFNRLLHVLGIQYRAGGTWVLYQDYAGNGYTQTNTYVSGLTTQMHTCWTQRGRLFLYEFLKIYDILPAIESELTLF